MKLAEALIERSHLESYRERLKERAIDNALVQEGDRASLSPMELLRQYEDISEKIASLTEEINRPNARTEFPEQGTLADALVKRDFLAQQIQAIQKISRSLLIDPGNEYSMNTLPTIRWMNPKILAYKEDELQKEYDTLELEIQKLNWETHLIQNTEQKQRE